MAYQLGVHPILNKLDGNRGYKLTGNKKARIFISKNGGASKTTFETSPTMVNNRNNASEFAGACIQGKGIYNKILTYLTLKHGHFLQRLNKAAIQIIKQGTGPAGQRTWDLSNNTNWFMNMFVNDFPFYNALNFKGSVTRTIYSTVTLWSYGSISRNDIFAPGGAQFYRLGLITLIKSDAMYDPTSKVYVPDAPSHDLVLGTFGVSAWNTLNFTVPYTIGCASVLGIAPTLPTDTVIAICCIQFAKLVNGVYTIMTGKQASQIKYVGH
jgi:hypothetical protein